MTVRLIGRSSSHYTRVARMFALELGVPFVFEPIFDLGSLTPATYGDNPALKMPVLVDDEGPLYGTRNICRRLAVGRADVVVEGEARIVANAEELALHAMNADVEIVLAKLAGQPPREKTMAGLANSLAWLDAHLDDVLTSLPLRPFSFVEVVLYCLVTHLPFREVLDPAPYGRLTSFCRQFGERTSARETTYRFDAKA